MRSSLVTTAVLSLCVAACSGESKESSKNEEVADGGGTGGSSGEEDAAPGKGGAPAKSGYLDPAAVKELTDLGVTTYSKKAVATGQETQDAAVRVTFDPASGPICLEGADYAAFYLDRGADKTMILLDGGGACWSGLCAADKTADEVVAAIGPAAATPTNYFRDWNLVFAPYCDGSVFSGDNEVDLGGGKTRYHHGRQNLAAALDLAVEHFGSSKQVLLGGFSAGGYGTIPGMIAVRLLFPDADLFVMDDSGPGIQNLSQTTAIQQRIDEWKFDEVIPASCTECDGGHGQLSALFSWMMERDPNIKISVLSYYEDPVIGVAFNGLDGPAYKALLTSETGKIQSAYPDRFKRYMLPGVSHVVSIGWGTVTADGVDEAAWVTAMATGDDTVWKDLLAAGP